jgi:hypothetical protein
VQVEDLAALIRSNSALSSTRTTHQLNQQPQTMTSIDQTIHAESLISTTARAFYSDDCVMLIDVLLRDKYLRDDDMAPRLNLPAKQLRRTLQFLEEEMLVKHELVDDLVMGGSQNTKVG